MKAGWWWLIPVLLGMFALGARGLNADSIWGDEYFSLYDAGGATFGPLTPTQIWERVAERNPWHTPGYFVLLSFWGQVAGWSVLSARGFSLLLGVLAVAWVYRLGADMVSKRVGLYAAVILASSAFFIHYLHEIRMYTLFVLVAALMVWLYLHVVRHEWLHPLWYAALFGMTLAILYTHYFAALPLAGIGVYHLLVVRKDRKWWLIAGLMLAAGLLFLPWMNQLLDVVGRSTDFETRDTSDNVPDTVYITGLLLEKFANGSLILMGAAAALAAWAVYRHERGARLAWFFALALLATFFAVNVVIDITHEGRLRYAITAFPFLAVVAAVGLTQLRRLAPLALAGWVAAGVWSSAAGVITDEMDGTLQFYPMHHVAHLIEANAQPGDVVVNVLPDVLPAWYYGGVVDYYFRTIGMDFRLLEYPARERWRAEQTTETLSSLASSPRVWLASMTDMPTTTRATFETALRDDGHFEQCSTIETGEPLDVSLFVRDPVCCWQAGNAPLVQFGADVALTGVSPLPTAVTDTLSLMLGWQLAPDSPPNTYSFALHIDNAAGELVAQQDAGLPYQQFTCQPTRLDLSGLPAGDHSLYLVVYRWQDGARLVGTPHDGSEPTDRLRLGRFGIER
jgi:hypothetical protein